MKTLTDLLKKLETDHNQMMKEALIEVSAKACYKTYNFSYRGLNYDVVFNLLTLDFVSKSKMSVHLRSKIKSRIIEAEFLKWKFKKEGRAFFDFLKLYYRDFDHVVFTDSESPDFIIHNHQNHGYEVTEATDRHNAKFNETVYLLTGMDKTTQEYRKYISQIQRSLQNKKRGSLHFQDKHALDIENIQDKIVECIIKKVKKYKIYEAELDTRNIIVFNNRIGFRRRSDFERLCHLIEGQTIIKASNIDKIFVISGTHDVMIEINKYGKLVSVMRNNPI